MFFAKNGLKRRKKANFWIHGEKSESHLYARKEFDACNGIIQIEFIALMEQVIDLANTVSSSLTL